MPIIKKRPYNSEFRKKQTQKTKEQIISASRVLFESKGFENVTIEEIAQSAEVSAPTIYALFQSKLGILRSLVDGVLAHDDFEILVRKAVAEKSPAKRLALSATIARQLYDAERSQLGMIQSALVLDYELKKMEIERENRRYQRQEKSLKETIRLGGLAQGLDEKKAQDILWALTGRDIYRLLVVERGWTSDEYEKWLAQVLGKILIKGNEI
ncbi:MAG: TetR/AcrR family transcriptional regulator [Thaumarchaeota archaeon]|nr:TetR/AcrR family transcriptional regulator [Nitrososphaerota archaeon]